MKFQTILSFAVCAQLLFVSCEKEKETNDTSTTSSTTSSTGTTNNSSFSFKVDGNTNSIDSSSATLYTSSLTGKRNIDVFAYKAGLMVLEFHFSPKTGSQTVNKDLNNAWLTYKASSDYTLNYHSVSGNFNLTTCDTINNKIEGTFDFVGENSNSDSKAISEGKLLVTKITKQ
jgi:hypothetical protein